MRQLLLSFLAIVLLVNNNKAQSIKTIPNGGFEIWDSTTYYDIDTPWSTKNSQYINQYGQAVVKKVPGQTGSAVHLQTYLVGHDTIEGVILHQNASYTQMPTGIRGFYRCNILGKDTAFILVEFMQGSSQVIATEKLPFTGTDTISFKSFNFKFPDSLSSMPTNVIMGVSSSNLINNIGITPGSWLELDQLSFTGLGITQPISAGDFESWTTFTTDLPNEWSESPYFGSNTSLSRISRSTDHYSGNYSLKVSEQKHSIGISLTSGIFNQFGTATGGQPYELKTDTLTGYYKYYASGEDSGFIYAILKSNNAIIAAPEFFFSKSSSWKYFELPIYSQSFPDTLMITLGSATNIQDTNGTILYLDDLQLKSEMHNSGINLNSKSIFGVSSFPYPAQNQLNIKFEDKVPAEFYLKIYNMEGQLMIDKDCDSGSSIYSLDISTISEGIYFYEITNNSNILINKFMKIN